MFTRTKDTGNRIKLDLEVLSHSNNYQFGTPGNGKKLSYVTNPEIRLQKWGANLANNTINLEHDLLGQTRQLNRDNITVNDYQTNKTSSNSNKYGQIQFTHNYTRLDDGRLSKKELKNNLYISANKIKIFEDFAKSSRNR